MATMVSHIPITPTSSFLLPERRQFLGKWGGRGDSEPEAERARVAWVGTNATSQRYEAKVRLFPSTFENPRPEVEVVAVDFVSRKTPTAPFLVAMTVEP